MDIIIRHAKPEDYEAYHRIFSGPRAIAGTLQLPLQSFEAVRRRFSEIREGLYHLVACVGKARSSGTWAWRRSQPSGDGGTLATS